jgi:uncharacterized protein YjbI with pentapeptide repeats
MSTHKALSDIISYMRGRGKKHNPGSVFNSRRMHNAPVFHKLNDFQTTPIENRLAKGAQSWNQYMQERLAKDANYAPDLSNLDLQAMDFAGYNLKRAKFQGSNLKKADFSGVHLKDVDFTKADLTRAKFYHSTLIGADFHETLLDNANFYGASIDFSAMINCSAIEINFDHAHLENSQFNDSDFTDADFTKAIIKDSNFERANLRRAHGGNARFEGNLKTKMLFTRASLDEARFIGATFSDCDFSYTQCNNLFVKRSKMTHCDFQSADLTKAHLGDGKFHDVSFNQANLNDTSFHKSELNKCSFEGADINAQSRTGGATHWTLAKISNCDFTGADIGFGVQNIFNAQNITGR